MGDFEWRELRKIRHRHEEDNKENTQSLHNIASKIKEMEYFIVGNVANVMELFHV
jgi:hypothetical protein